MKSLGTGEEASVHGGDHFDSASTIKIAMMDYAYQMADQHKLNLNDRYAIKASDFRGGPGVFHYMSTEASIRPSAMSSPK